jgi:hypothetical protein
MAPRTIGALAMRPTGNAQGSYYYFKLSISRIINRCNATKIPMPDDVIERVHTLARRQNDNNGMIFTDRNNVIVDNQNDDASVPDDYDSNKFLMTMILMRVTMSMIWMQMERTALMITTFKDMLTILIKMWELRI